MEGASKLGPERVVESWNEGNPGIGSRRSSRLWNERDLESFNEGDPEIGF